MTDVRTAFATTGPSASSIALSEAGVNTVKVQLVDADDGWVENATGDKELLIVDTPVAGKEGSGDFKCDPTDGPDSEVETIVIPRDTFSFFAIANIFTMASLLGLAVFSLQIGIFALTIMSLLQDNPPNNPLNLPTTVSYEVLAAQLLAILITAATLIPDTTNTAFMASVPVEDLQKSLRKEYSTSRCKVYLTVAMRFVESTSAAAASFFLIIQSTEVIELFFNFAALMFVSSLDNLAFQISMHGFLGFSSSCVMVARQVADSQVRICRKRLHKKLWLGRFYICVLLALMMIGWGVIVSKQLGGQYDCQSLSVQLGDEFNGACALMSGIYTFERRDKEHRHPDYANHEAGATLKYDSNVKAWTFEGPHCVVYSSETEEFDVMQVPGSVQWNVYFPFNKYHGGVLAHFSLMCNDCDRQEEADANSSKKYLGRCSGRGKCVQQTCECDDGFDGPTCELYNPAKWCEFLVTDPYWVDEYTLDSSWDGNYVMMRKPEHGNLQYLKMYGRPVYFGYSEDTYGKFIMFTGRRYIKGDANSTFGASTYNELLEMFSNELPVDLMWGSAYDDDEQTIDFAKDQFSDFYSNSYHAAVSEPADYGTREYQEPVASMKWYAPDTEGADFFWVKPDTLRAKGGHTLACVPQCNETAHDYVSDAWMNNSCSDDWERTAYKKVYASLVAK